MPGPNQRQSPAKHISGKEAHDSAHKGNSTTGSNTFVDDDHNTETTIKNKAAHDKKLATNKSKSSPATHTVTVGEKKGTQAPTQKGANTHNSSHTSGHFVNDRHDTEKGLANKKIHDEKNLAKNKEAKSSPATQTKSGKGNIFTKRGRKQRAINKYAKARGGYFADSNDKTKRRLDKSYTKLHKAQRNTEHDLTQYTYDKEAGRLNAYQKQEQDKMLNKNKSKKSPAKCPLVAALAPAVIGAMSKKKE